MDKHIHAPRAMRLAISCQSGGAQAFAEQILYLLGMPIRSCSITARCPKTFALAGRSDHVKNSDGNLAHTAPEPSQTLHLVRFTHFRSVKVGCVHKCRLTEDQQC
jgi:hypothetical protein